MKAECVSPRSLSSDLSYTRQVFVVDEWLAPPSVFSPLLSRCLSSFKPQSRSLSESHVRSEHMASASLVTSPELAHSDLLCSVRLQTQCAAPAERECSGVYNCGRKVQIYISFIRFYWVFYPAAVSCLDLCPSRPCCFEPLGHHSNGRQVVRAL